MDALEEMETGLDIILSKLKSRLHETINIFYDFETTTFEDFASKEEIEILVTSCLEIQRGLKETRVALEAYLDAREVYLECLGMDAEPSLAKTPIVKKGEP